MRTDLTLLISKGKSNASLKIQYRYPDSAWHYIDIANEKELIETVCRLFECEAPIMVPHIPEGIVDLGD